MDFVIHAFGSNNALYSISLSFTMFIFRLIPFNNSDCYYFESNLSMVLLVQKHKNYVLQSSKHEKMTFHCHCFLLYTSFNWGNIIKKNVVKSGRYIKDIQ